VSRETLAPPALERRSLQEGNTVSVVFFLAEAVFYFLSRSPVRRWGPGAEKAGGAPGRTAAGDTF